MRLYYTFMDRLLCWLLRRHDWRRVDSMGVRYCYRCGKKEPLRYEY